jgi:hypothetical protein
MPIYVGLYKKRPPFHSDDPDIEVSGGNYARQEVKFNYIPDGRLVASNSEQVRFPMATEAWNYIDLLKLHADNGSVIEIPLTVPVNVQVGMQARFEPGSINILTEWDTPLASTVKEMIQEDPFTWKDLSDLAAATFMSNRSVWERAVDDEL